MKAANTPEQTQSKYKLSDFFNAHWPDYVKAPKTRITDDQFRGFLSNQDFVAILLHPLS